jgi:hypothetical protein
MSVPVQAILAREQSIERIEEVIVGAGADLEDDEPCRGMRHEHRQEAIPILGDIGEERGARRRQVGDPAGRTRPDAERSGLYGKMLRSASRIRPRPPPAGADS